MPTPFMSLLLPPLFEGWFRARGWTPHAHQLSMIEAAVEGRHALLIAPTGGGKTLAGFLPSLVELAERPREGLHTLYLSPLKALAVDIHRNLETPIAELRLGIRAETRTGDTPQPKRNRQRLRPPQILMTTPESLALMLSYPDSRSMFGSLRTVVVDELHALAGTKRGDLLSLGMARLAELAPTARRVGLSATVAWPEDLVAWLSPDGRGGTDDVRVIRGRSGARARVSILIPEERIPWAGHMGRHAVAEVYQAIAAHGVTIVFVNTRAQAELVFQELWRMNDAGLAIGLHHGSLAAEQRRKVEAAMAAGRLSAVVATSSLDLGIDWGDVDLVVQIGAPKGASRLIQRIGRSRHQIDTPSEAILVPANRFEVLECKAALDAVDEGELDGVRPASGGLDVLAQHVMGMACSAPFLADDLYREVTRAAPYAGLGRKDFDDVLAYVATGGYALGAYERYKRLKQDEVGRWRLAGAHFARSYRMNLGTIVEATTLPVRFRRGALLGRIEEYFVQGLVAGDTFIFAGQRLRFEGMRDGFVEVTRGGEGEPRVPVYAGGRLPLTTELARRVRQILSDPSAWPALPEPVQEWLRLQRWRSVLPKPGDLLVETFPRAGRHFLVAYCFEGRNAHQTLGMLLSRRMERAGLKPQGFVATDYVIALWGLAPVTDVAGLFDEDMLGDDLEAWMAESSMLRRTFRHVAVIAGLVERRHPGLEKRGRQLDVNTDLIYDVLREHEPDHVLLRATRADAARGLADVGRLASMLARIKGRIVHRALDRVSPLAVPILLEVGREQVYGEAADHQLAEAEARLLSEAVPELVESASSQRRLPY